MGKISFRGMICPGANLGDGGHDLYSFSLQEEYGGGWSGTAIMKNPTDEHGDLIQFHEKLCASQLRPDDTVLLQLVGYDSEGIHPMHNKAMRTWPCVLTVVDPFYMGVEGTSSTAAFLRLVDPITYLAETPVWGAYRAESIGRMIGGTLSMAASGDGRPSLEPVLPNLPRITIVEEVRDALLNIPYTIAAGQTLGQWLGEVLGGLAIRSFLCGRVAADGTGEIDMMLAQQMPTTAPVIANAIDITNPKPPTEFLEDKMILYVTGYGNFPSLPSRAGLLDNPSFGSPISFGPMGAVETYIHGAEVDYMEAYLRRVAPMYGEFLEMFRLQVRTRQPLMKPGQMLNCPTPVNTISDWQVARTAHHLRRTNVYQNDATLLSGDYSWFPARPPERPPIYVSGVVDGGSNCEAGDLVPRDDMGRIRVSFPFTPTPVGDEAALLLLADTDDDRRITIDDFSSDQITIYEDPDIDMEGKVAHYLAGDYDDLNPGDADSALTPEQLAERQRLQILRDEAIRYIAYKRAKEMDSEDRDHDDFVSDRDALVSDELTDALRDDDKRSWLEEKWLEQEAAREEERRKKGSSGSLSDPDTSNDESEDDTGGGDDDDTGGGDDDDTEDDSDPLTGPAFDDVSVEDQALIDEYGAIFKTNDDPTDKDYDAKLDATYEPERWPPRLPLSIVEPMAGLMHGFITGHRQGDTCRVAVFNPFSAEILGFQYRVNTQITEDVQPATAGVIVKHNYADSWSGILIRQTQLIEGDEPPWEGDPDTTDSENS